MTLIESNPSEDRSERIVAKLVAVGGDSDLEPVLGTFVIESLGRPGVLSGKFSPQQFERLLNAFSGPLRLSPETIQREVFDAQAFSQQDS